MHGRGGREEGGGHDRGGRDRARFIDGENERNISTSSWKANTDTTSLTLAATFHSKFQESMDQPSWSTDKANPVSAAFMPLIKKAAGRGGQG
jgi:hypothetical protein